MKRACQHLIQWPSAKEILAGVIVCPYCTAEYLEQAAEEFRKEAELVRANHTSDSKRMRHDHGELMRMVERVNARNSALQMLIAQSPEKIEALRQIDIAAGMS